MQIDYLLLAIIVSPLVFGVLLAYVARKNKGDVAQLPNANDSFDPFNCNIYDYRYAHRDIYSHDD